MSKRREQKSAPTEPNRPAWGPPARSALALGLMTLGILAVYFPVADAPTDNALFGIDYHQLHARRIRFAQESLSGGEGAGTLPGWYPRELMGTPFWSNIQNFPFIPTRLAVVLTSDPLGAFYAGVNLAAVLSGGFTFLYGRVGLGRTAAAGAGWTFACAGFFASRVMAGHLPLLEAYPAPATSPTTAPAHRVGYQRPSPDEMILEVNAPADGFLRILEAWDPGWSATVNGREVEPLPADGFYLGIPVSAGPNEVRLTFTTPGRGLGILVALGGVVALLLVAFAPIRGARPTSQPGVKTGP